MFQTLWAGSRYEQINPGAAETAENYYTALQESTTLKAMTMDKAFILSKAPLAAAIALTAGMVASFSLQGYRLWQQNDDLVTPEAGVQAQAPAKSSAPDAKQLANVHLFGEPAAQTAAQPLQTENLPETNLRLTLRGVSASDTEGLASALVEGPDQQTQVYLIGDTLPGNALLRAIYPTRIVIERRGRLENLYFPEDRNDSSSSISSYADTRVEEPSYADEQDYQPEQSYQQEQDNQEEQAYQEENSTETYTADTPTDAFVPDAVQSDDAPTPTYGLDALSEERKQEIRERLQQLRERIMNQ